MRTVPEIEYNNRNETCYETCCSMNQIKVNTFYTFVVSFTFTNVPRLLIKIFKLIVVIDSDTVVCGSNMLRRLAKYTVDMTCTMGQVGNIIQRTDKYGHNLQSALINCRHNTNIH